MPSIFPFLTCVTEKGERSREGKYEIAREATDTLPITFLYNQTQKCTRDTFAQVAINYKACIRGSSGKGLGKKGAIL